jgi:hypothetical protein
MDRFSVEILLIGVFLLLVILAMGILLEKYMQKKIDEEVQREIRDKLYK